MNPMERGPETYEEIFRVYHWVFRAVGVLPTSSTLLTHLLTVYFQIVNTLYYTMHMGAGVRMLKNHNVEIEYVFETALIQGLSTRFLILSCKRKKLAELTAICEELWQMLRAGEGRIVKGFEKKVRYLMYYFAWTTLSAICFYILTAQVVRLPPAEVNGTERRILPTRFYVDVQEQPWYNLVTILQSTVCYSYTFVVLSIELIGPYTIMMACGYLRSIHNRLLAVAESSSIESIDVEESSDGKSTVKESRANKSSESEVMECVKFHQKIMDFCRKIEEFASILFLVQVMCTAYNISLILLKLLEQDPNAIKYVPILLLNLLQFFTCQWIPQFLLNESKAIVDAAYSASLVHPEFDSKTNRALLFMMLRAQRPVQMTAGGYINLSLETFQRMFMSAVSFFTVLRSMSEQMVEQ